MTVTVTVTDLLGTWDTHNTSVRRSATSGCHSHNAHTGLGYRCTSAGQGV